MTSTARPSPGVSPSWSIALGVLLIVAGVVALVFPILAAVSAALYIGWFALVAGGVAIVAAVRTRSEPHFGWRLAVGVLYVVLGLLLVANPAAAAASLALLVGALMAASGGVDLVLAFRHRPQSGWGWLLADGVVSIVLAAMIVIGWPLGSLVLIGYLVGFQIITCGVARLGVGMGARKAGPAPAA